MRGIYDSLKPCWRRAAGLLLAGLPVVMLLATPPAGADLYFTGFQSGVAAMEAQTAGGQTAVAGAGPASGAEFASNADRASSAELNGRAVSRKKAIGASLLIPGWGQYLTGHHTKAKAFIVAEVAILASYAFFGIQGTVRQNRYIDYAEEFAGIADASGKEDYYYRNLGAYGSSDDYIESIRRGARSLYGDDIEAREDYVARFSPRGDEQWAWQSDAYRRDYLQQRKDSRNSFRLAGHMVGVALLNRVVSAVDAALSAGKTSRSQRVYLETAGDGTQRMGVQVPLN